MTKGGTHSPEARARISHGTRRGLARRAWLEAERDRLIAALHSPGPAEIEALRRSGALSESTAIAADVAAATILRLRRAVEGEPSRIDGRPPRPLSPQRVARLGNAQRLLTLGIALEMRALTADDREAASSAGTLIRAADSIITDTLGMDLEVEIRSLSTYLAECGQGAGAADGQTNGSSPAAETTFTEVET